MILRNKGDSVASRSLRKIFDDIQEQTQKGNFGLIFSSSYTINTQVELESSKGNIKLIDALKGLSANVVTLFLLPPPTNFSGNHRCVHAENILKLMETGALVWFDRAVHSKFLFFWSFNQRQLIEHSRYYGSTNFTKGGLHNNIEEFYYNRRNWKNTVSLPKFHLFYLKTILKYIERITKLYESPEYLHKNLDNLQDKIKVNLNELKQRAYTAKDLIEKLEVSILSYSFMLDTLCSIWNLPGKRFAYDMGEKILLEVDDYSSFNLEFLEEIIIWPNETFQKFTEQWKINIERYFEIPEKVIRSISILEENLQEYRKSEYKIYTYDEEKELIQNLKNEHTRNNLSILRDLARSETNE